MGLSSADERVQIIFFMKTSIFQIVLLGIFILFIIVGVAAFALYRGESAGDRMPSVTIWGTFPADVFNAHVTLINQKLREPIVVQYVQKTVDQFSPDFIAALARGGGPDGILIPADMILPHSDKISAIPFSALSQRTFQDLYIQEGDIYVTSAGIMGIPFTIDPLIMYWNRDMFDAAGIAAYPRFWDEFTELNRKLTVKDQNGNVRRSALAMGDFTNVANARELLGSLLFQVGNPVTYRNAEGTVMSALQAPLTANPETALGFFTQAVDPSHQDYSWNRGMPNSKSAFLSGMLATYFGFASEIADIRTKNPNLNFDAALLPQVRKGGVKATYGRMYGLSIVRASTVPNAVYQIAWILTAPEHLEELSRSIYIPPVRRDLIALGSSDQYLSLFNEAALVSRTWLDADPLKSRQLFGTLVSWITTGQKRIDQAVRDASEQYDIILEQAVR